jgi:hypothetical protein
MDCKSRRSFTAAARVFKNLVDFVSMNESLTLNVMKLPSLCNLVDPNSVKDAKDLPYMQRPGGSADDSDLGGKKGGLFNFFQKKEPEPEPEPEPKKNFWTF